MKTFRRSDLYWVVLFVFGVGLSLAVGATNRLDWIWIRELRVPRTILAFAVGAALSLAGAILQAVFKNPLCEPYTLGVSSGATLGTVIGATLGVNTLFLGLSPAALAGAGLFSGVLVLTARRKLLSTSTLLLVGVMLSFLGSSLVAVWMALSEPAGVQAAVSWLLGDISRAEPSSSVVSLGVVFLFFLFIIKNHRSFDALLLGEDEAKTLGLDFSFFRIRSIVYVSVLVSVAVSLAGMIGFIGLIVPQIIRRTGSSLHFRVLPLSALVGGTFLVIADAIARSIVAPYELPVGVVTAIVGAPFFIFLILKRGPTL